MNTAVSKGTLLGEIPRFIETGVVDEQALVSKRIEQDTGWASVVDKLIEWAVNPETVCDDEEGIPAPSSTVIALAGKVAKSLREMGLPRPQRMISDGEGGIVFEWWSGQAFQMIKVRPSQVVEAMLFVSSKLINRVTLPIG